MDVRALLHNIYVFERGWLSSNNILITGESGTALIDSGYCTHAEQTLSLVETALQGRELDTLVNTHLHSDHCGGNAELQARYPKLQTLIPPGHADAVSVWDAQTLGYIPTGQNCPRFAFNATLQPGAEMQWGESLWQVHAAPGHDTHSVILFQPERRVLVSADALWERGFGVVFPELDEVDAFDEVSDTLDLIERLQPVLVIPGHGALFTDVGDALARARQRLEGFVSSPAKHLLHAAKVLLKYKLLEFQTISRTDLFAWMNATPYCITLMQRCHPQASAAEAFDALLQDLVRAGATRVSGDMVHNS
jgi:glyoxylase-like metal-dependent hydrolase (beta-lactamase superfamily II)